MAARPFASDDDAFAAAERSWRELGEADRLEAFAAHPRIGTRELEERWSRAEQAGVEGAAPATLAALARRNEDYERRFGFVFLICATGLTADAMLAALEDRSRNDRATELANASREQEKIVRLRLERLRDEVRGGGGR